MPWQQMMLSSSKWRESVPDTDRANLEGIWSQPHSPLFLLIFCSHQSVRKVKRATFVFNKKKMGEMKETCENISKSSIWKKK